MSLWSYIFTYNNYNYFFTSSIPYSNKDIPSSSKPHFREKLPSKSFIFNMQGLYHTHIVIRGLSICSDGFESLCVCSRCCGCTVLFPLGLVDHRVRIREQRICSLCNPIFGYSQLWLRIRPLVQPQLLLPEKQPRRVDDILQPSNLIMALLLKESPLNLFVYRTGSAY